MSCEHARTTVLLHLYGESPPWYAGHLARCAECQEALAEHAVTVGLVEPVFQDEQVLTMEQETIPATAAIDLPVASPRSTRTLLWVAAAAAAVVLAGGWAIIAGLAEEPAPTETPMVEVLPWEDPIDDELDLLDSEFDALARDLEEL
jgi:hypothetical protein